MTSNASSSHRAVQLSWQLERADRALAARTPTPAPPAPTALDDLADEVAALGRRLFWDPRGPTFFYPQFEITLGDPRARLLVGPDRRPRRPGPAGQPAGSPRRWAAPGCWTAGASCATSWRRARSGGPRDRFKAIRLLGRQPLDMDEDDRVMAIYLSLLGDGAAGGGWRSRTWATSCTGTSRSGSTSGPAGGGVLGRIPADAEAGRAALLELVGEEEGRLEERLAMLLERPEPSGAEWEFDASEAGERLRRYQATCDRTLLRVLEALRKRRRDADGSGDRTAPPGPPRPGRRRRTRSAGSRAC